VIAAISESNAMRPVQIYQVFLTRNSEYHMQSQICVGVRDRRTGRWFLEHPALLRSLSGAVLASGQVAPLHLPNLGESLEFLSDGEPVRTSPVLNVEERNLQADNRAVRRMTPRPVSARHAEDPRVTR
jgi:hypothetical protein